jgi:hypothetical protein
MGTSDFVTGILPEAPSFKAEKRYARPCAGTAQGRRPGSEFDVHFQGVLRYI